MKKLTKYNVTYYNGITDNKISYHLFQRVGQPIHLKVSFFAGARFDNIPGIAHFLEHMLLAGSKKYPNKRLLTNTLENIGGWIGASTNNDFLTISLEFADKKDWSFALKILDEVINQPLFDKKTIEAERGSILSEIQVRFYNRVIHAMDMANTLIYQQTPCGQMVIGDKTSVNKIKKDDLIRFYETVFKKNPVNWSVAGDVSEDELIATINKFNKPEISFNQLVLADLPIIRKETTRLENFEDNQADLHLSFRTESAKLVDMASLEIISSYLAKDRGCKLQDELRYKRGLIYSCRGNNYPSLDHGEWYIATSCLANNTQEVLNIIIKELNKIKKNGLTETELNLVKNKLIKSNALKLQTSQNWAERGSQPGFVAMSEKFLVSNYERDIAKTSNESLIKTVRKYFTNNNWFLAICGPKSLAKIKVKFYA